MASVVEDLNDILNDLEGLKVDLGDIAQKVNSIIDFLDEQIERLEED